MDAARSGLPAHRGGPLTGLIHPARRGNCWNGIRAPAVAEPAVRLNVTDALIEAGLPPLPADRVAAALCAEIRRLLDEA
ncbi:hypothetical protein ACFWF3_02380 [Nocardia sp. NPDC060220]|uniref:hypothetical protein n=1 Tax=Nocardia sp. NPDC060220 TaxID=3347076 RepID=UPI0036555EE7